MKDKKWVIISFILLVINNCQSTQIIDNKFLNSQRFYKITLPDESWERVNINKEDIAMRNKESNAMFAIISHPMDTNKTTLDTLYKQLFIGIKRNDIVNKQYVYVNNQRVLNIVLEGELDNFKVKISAYIINVNDLVHDIVYWSVPEKFDSSLGDFERVVESFEFIN
ncbi:MAG: hypothetical protein SCARUB_00931 [Candidatus Scalindua rubra]|uniref:PsbP C-terminal domain-containing protein n=1 Tax=Candidatus Scalindua rubra TaxID=1872076 RepID=A0A1E3XEC6_9BACT|nr:MAG: hypothetical protein SCARUB_00931 [Candidatus Scalindua rubra]